MSKQLISYGQSFIQLILKVLENDLVHRTILLLIIIFASLEFYISIFRFGSEPNLFYLFILAVLGNLFLSFCPDKYYKELSKMLSAVIVLCLIYTALMLLVFYVAINAKS